LAAAILKILRDETLKKNMGVLGRKRVERLFTWPKVAERTIEVYKELIGERA
jgi:glycosyltransferase involved in cell wall biosynthesis